MAGLASPVLAVPTPNTGAAFRITLPGTSLAAEPALAATIEIDRRVPFVSSDGRTTGFVQVRTARTRDGKLTFAWFIRNGAASADSIRALTLTFPRAVYDANYRTDAVAGERPFELVGTPHSAISMRYTFRFANTIRPVQSSTLFFLRANATDSRPARAEVTLTTPDTVQVDALAPR